MQLYRHNSLCYQSTSGIFHDQVFRYEDNEIKDIFNLFNKTWRTSRFSNIALCCSVESLKVCFCRREGKVISRPVEYKVMRFGFSSLALGDFQEGKQRNIPKIAGVLVYGFVYLRKDQFKIPFFGDPIFTRDFKGHLLCSPLGLLKLRHFQCTAQNLHIYLLY